MSERVNHDDESLLPPERLDAWKENLMTEALTYGSRTRRPTTRYFQGGVAVAVVALLMGGFVLHFNNNSAPAPIKVVLASSDKVVAAGSSSVSVTFSTGSSGDGLTMTTTGTADYVDQTAQLVTDGTSNGRNFTLSQVVSGSNVYTKQVSGPSLNVGTASRPWSKTSTSGLNNQAASNPQDLARLVQAASEVTSSLGRQTVHGMTTTHYRVSLNFDDAAGRSTGPDQTYFAGLASTMGHGVVPADIWIDEQGRLIEMRLAYTPPENGSVGASASTNVQLDVQFFDFGIPTSISLPPADEVTTASAPAR